MKIFIVLIGCLIAVAIVEGGDISSPWVLGPVGIFAIWLWVSSIRRDCFPKQPFDSTCQADGRSDEGRHCGVR